MSETIQIIIATLSGFIIAFFAEPVKTYFQNRAKLYNLRIALYKEIIFNYGCLLPLNEDSFKSDRDNIINHTLRTECYRHAIQNELTLFYQLSEAATINILYGMVLDGMIALSANRDKFFGGQNGINEYSANMMNFSRNFQRIFTKDCYEGTLDAKILMIIVKANRYREIMKIGEEHAKKA